MIKILFYIYKIFSILITLFLFLLILLYTVYTPYYFNILHLYIVTLPTGIGSGVILSFFIDWNKLFSFYFDNELPFN